MRRKKKHEDHVDESWLIPYADILTLLLALFIVLFAASEIDSKKYQELTESFNSALQGGSGVLPHEAAAVEQFEDTSPIPKIGDENPTAIGEDEEGTEKETEITPEQDQEKLEEIQENIEAYIEEKGLSSKLETELTTQGLLLTIKDGVLFQSGSADVSGNARTIATEISDLLISDPPREIRIEGHTDNYSINTARFPSNWELSSARAINFMKVLLRNDDLDPKKFSAIGYGEHRPISDNNSAEGRAQNRRVEVLISPYQQQN